MGVTAGCVRRIIDALTRLPMVSAKRLTAWATQVAAVGLLGILAGLAAAADPGAAAGTSPVHDPRHPAPASSLIEYRIGPLDTIAVTVTNHPDVSTIARVQPDGYVSLTFLKDIRAAGKTPRELANEIEGRLSAFVVEPKVMVEILEAFSVGWRVSVIGEAVAPRPLPFRLGMTVLDVLTEVSGLTPFANGNQAMLIRGSGPSSVRMPLRLDDLVERGDLSANLPLQAGDIIIVPRGFFAGNWQTSAAVTLSETYTDNVSLDPDGQRDPALITALTPAITLAGEGGRIEGALSAAVTGEYQALSHSGPSALFNVLGTSTAELLRDSLFVDALASITEQPLSPTAGTSSAESNSTNLTTVQAYSVSPYLVTRLKNFADVEARYIFGATLTGGTGGDSDRQNAVRDSDSLSDSVTNGGIVSLRSPEDIAPRLQVQQTTYALHTTRFGESDVIAAGAAAMPSYAIAPGLALLATGGYDVLDDGDESLQGPNLAAGFRYQPSPTFSLNASGGWRLEHPQADVVLRYDVGPQTVLGLTYNEGVGVGQTSLLQNLGTLGYDPVDGRFINQQTSLAYSPMLTGVDISDELTRTQRGTLGVQHRQDNDDFSFNLYAARQKAVDGGSQPSDDRSDATLDDQKSVGASAAWGRRLNPTLGLAASVGFQYTDANGETADQTPRSDAVSTGTFQTAIAGVTLTHDFSEKLTGFIGYRFQRRFAEDSDDEFTENAALLGVTQRF